MHMRNIHSKEMNFTCSICFKSFKNDRYGRQHERRVHKKDLVECNECNETFDRYYLKSHVSTVHDKTFQIKCEICDKIIVGNKQHLIIHSRTVHLKTFEENHKCATVLAVKRRSRQKKNLHGIFRIYMKLILPMFATFVIKVFRI